MPTASPGSATASFLTLIYNNSRHWPSNSYLLRHGGFENRKMYDNENIRGDIKRGLPHPRTSADNQYNNTTINIFNRAIGIEGGQGGIVYVESKHE